MLWLDVPAVPFGFEGELVFLVDLVEYEDVWLCVVGTIAEDSILSFAGLGDGLVCVTVLSLDIALAAGSMDEEPEISPEAIVLAAVDSAICF